MISNTQISHPQTLSPKSGLVFSLPQPILAPHNYHTGNNNNHNCNPQFGDGPNYPFNLHNDFSFRDGYLNGDISKNKAKMHSHLILQRQRSNSMLKPSINSHTSLSTKKQDHSNQQTLYKKFIKKSKRQISNTPDSNFSKTKSKISNNKEDKTKSIEQNNNNSSRKLGDDYPQHNINVKLRQLNLVVLSKKEEFRKTLRTKLEKEKEIIKEINKQKQIQNDGQKQKNNRKKISKNSLNPVISVSKSQPHSIPHTVSEKPSLPHFARSKSSFYKAPQDQTTLSFLSKTIFSQIQNHFTTRFHRQKAIEPIELGITKAKIQMKGVSKAKRKRKFFLEFGSFRDNGQLTDVYQQIFESNRVDGAYGGQYNINPSAKINNFENANTGNKYNRHKNKNKSNQLTGWEQEALEFNLFNLQQNENYPNQ